MSKRQKITASIDGKSINVTLGTTILQAARKAGVYIPTLCYLESLSDYGGCRLCMVSVENMRGFPTACTTPLSHGMKVTTKTAELQQLRREILELILSEHPYTCLVCKEKKECHEYMHSTRKVSTTTGCNFCSKNGKCELQYLVDYLELKGVRYPIIYRNLPVVTDNPFYTIDYNLCILCGRCVRVCNDERYSEVLAFIHRGNRALVGTAFNETQKEAGCEYCGACVDVCPTGSLTEKQGSWAGLADASTSTHCIFCSIGCGISVNTKGNTIVSIGPEPGKLELPQQLCVRGKFIPGNITHHPARVLRPQIKKQGKWREVAWQEAFTCIADNLKKYSGEHFGLIGSAHDTTENSFILQDFSRRIMRSPNIDIYPAFGYSTMMKDIHTYYSTAGHTSLEDISSADKIYVVGAQTHWSHPIIENRIRKAYSSGKEVFVAGSAVTRTVNFSTGFHSYKRGCEHIYLYELMEKLTADKSVERIVMIIGDEALHSDFAEENISTLMRIVALSNSIVKLLFLLPEGNRYGAVMAGMNPSLLPGFSVTAESGFTAPEMLTKYKESKAISALYLVGDIPPTMPLRSLQFFVQQNMFFTPASKYAHVFLPITAALESSGHAVNFEGKYIHMPPAIPMDDMILPTKTIINAIVSELGGEMFNMKTDSILQKLHPHKSIAKIQAAAEKSASPPKGIAPKPDSRTQNGHLTGKTLKKYHFHYMGNSLVDIVPDLAEVLQK